MSNERYTHDRYLVRKKVFTLFGHVFEVYDDENNIVLYSKQKAFKLKEDIRVYTGEDMNTEVLRIKARNIIDFSAAYDVFDPNTNETVGTLRRKGFRSLLQDKWEILDTTDSCIGTIEEDSMLLALVRRFLSNLVPQAFTVTVNGHAVCHYRRRFNPFILKTEVDCSQDINREFDRRLALAAVILITAIEGRQN